MMFDHGLDSTTAVVVMYQLGRIHNMGGGLLLLIFIMMSSVPFYYFTLEEYYLGKLTLPMFSGPDDTSVAISAVCFLTTYLGSDYWLQEHDFLGFGKMKSITFAISILFFYQQIASQFSIV